MRIGEVATATGVTTKTLRYYEDIGLLPPPARQANGYRNYSPDTRTRVEFITRGRKAGLSLANLRVLLDLRDTGQAPLQPPQRHPRRPTDSARRPDCGLN